ncbi:MAG: PulJ/GspJ family protein [Microcystaceae cyanobacterium]
MKKHLKNRKKAALNRKPQKVSKGFTLVELLIAAVISSFVIGAAGFGLVTMMQSNQTSDAKTQRRVELSRALDYIAEDIKMAKRVAAASSYTISSPSPSGAVATPVLELTIPDATGTDTKVVYYLNNINNASGVWLKPAVIKRVDNVTGTTIAGSTGNELVDAIITTGTAPSCSGTLAGTGGFYACIAADNRTVDLYLYGKLANSSETFAVSSKVFARSTPP